MGVLVTPGCILVVFIEKRKDILLKRYYFELIPDYPPKSSFKIFF